VRAQHPEAVHGVPPDVLELGGDLGLGAPGGGGPLDDLVVDIGDVRDVVHLDARPLEVAAQHVVGEDVAAVPDVGRVVDRGPAHVERHLPGLPLGELAHLTGGGVM
jgi:hypothetical protein